jgi:hypothetical protein
VRREDGGGGSGGGGGYPHYDVPFGGGGGPIPLPHHGWVPPVEMPPPHQMFGNMPPQKGCVKSESLFDSISKGDENMRSYMGHGSPVSVYSGEMLTAQLSHQ